MKTPLPNKNDVTHNHNNPIKYKHSRALRLHRFPQLIGLRAPLGGTALATPTSAAGFLGLRSLPLFGYFTHVRPLQGQAWAGGCGICTYVCRIQADSVRM